MYIPGMIRSKKPTELTTNHTTDARKYRQPSRIFGHRRRIPGAQLIRKETPLPGLGHSSF